MDKESKSFFEKLSGVKSQDEDVEEELESDDNDIDDDNDEEDNDEDNGTGVEEDIEGQLTVDVYETPSSFVIKSAVAGVDSDKLDISITNEAVTIKGERSSEEKVKTDNYLHRECYWGRFSRSIILPQEIDPDKAKAQLKNGILRIELPKINKTKSKKLKVKFE